MDEATRRDIDEAVERLLYEADIAAPPVPIPVVVDHMNINRAFYDLRDPSFLRRWWHKIRIKGRRLVKRALRVIKLDALLLYDQEKIVINESLPEIKHDWATSHELMHRLLEWHRPYFYGDTAQTLDPTWQDLLEGEASYGASALMFCGRVFTAEARDLPPAWASVQVLRKRNGKSHTATFRRFVEHGPECAMAGLVSTARWQSKREGQLERWRYFFTSPQFRSSFGFVDARQLLEVIDANIVKRRGGPVGEYTVCLRDDDGRPHEFRAGSFSNTHNILTLFAYVKELKGKLVVVRS